MIFHPMIGGGGASISVKAYASADELPTTAKDGAIAVISAIPVGTVFVQSTEPSAAKNGALWILFAANGTLPTVGGNVIIYPQRAFQYTDGAWTALPMKVYKDGLWVDATGDVVIYTPSDEAEEITGGWYATSAAQIVKNANGMEIYNGFVSTALKIDLTHYSLLKVDVRCRSGASSFVGIGTTQTEFVASTETGKDESTYFTRVVDLEAVTGEYYILIQSRSSSTPLYISKVELIA